VDEAGLARSLRRWKITGVVVLLLLVVSLPLSGAVDVEKRSTATAEERFRTIEQGGSVFATNCARCHGDHGEGFVAPALDSSQFQSAATEDRIHLIASAGVPGTLMPAWSNSLGGPLTDEQIWDVAAFIVAWRDGAPSIPDWRTRFLGTPPTPTMAG